MTNERLKTLTLLLLVLLALSAWRVLSLQAEARKWERKPMPTSQGLGEDLELMVKALEEEISARIHYTPPTGPDPFDLRKVVNMPSRQQVGEKSEGVGMRLTMTLLSPQKSVAVLKHGGQSFTLAMGDSLDGWFVREIGSKTVTLQKGEVVRVLVNQPAPKAELQREGGVRRVEDLKL